jgi:hypothetical protein
MKKLLQSSAILFLALMLVMATGGFSIYRHFCYCAGKDTASFFSSTTCQLEKAAVKSQSCCHTEVPACCKDKAPVKHENSCNKDNCCNSSSTFFKISDNYTVSIGKVSLKFVVSFVQYLIGNTLLSEPEEFVAQIPEFNDTSPPLFGTDLLHHLHQLKIAHLLV